MPLYAHRMQNRYKPGRHIHALRTVGAVLWKMKCVSGPFLTEYEMGLLDMMNDELTKEAVKLLANRQRVSANQECGVWKHTIKR